jgi:hypothetical protein
MPLGNAFDFCDVRPYARSWQLPRRARSMSSLLMIGGLRSVGLLGGSVEVAPPVAMGSLAGNDMSTALSIFLSCSWLRPNNQLQKPIRNSIVGVILFLEPSGNVEVPI